MKNRKILITGGTGFVGANFVHAFLELGYEVHLFVRENSDFKRIEAIKSKVFLHPVDLLEEQAVRGSIEEIKPDVILHFATYGAYPGIQKDEKTIFLTNVLGTSNLLNACAHVGFSCFINTGSSSEYGTKSHPMSEKDILEPNNTYGVSKAAATLLCQSLAIKNELPLITFRPFSVYGYFEESTRLMPNIISAGLHDTNFSAPSPSLVRDFIFIEDVVGAYLKAIENIDTIKWRIFNIASGKQHSIADVIHAVEKILGKKINVSFGTVAAKQHEPTSWVADISEIRKAFGWSPAFSLEGGLRKYIEWFKKHEQG